MTGVGFGLGDVAIRDLATEFGILPADLGQRDMIFVIDAEPTLFDRVLSLTAELRRRDFAAVYSYKRQSLVKQLKQAAGRGATRVIIVDQAAAASGLVALKDMGSGVQKTLPIDSVLDAPHQDLGPPA